MCDHSRRFAGEPKVSWLNRETNWAPPASPSTHVDAAICGIDLFDGGRALAGLKRLDEARERLAQALAIGHELKQHEIIARSQLALAETAYAAGDIAQSRHMLDEITADLVAAR